MSITPVIRTSIIGTGGIAHTHAEALRSLEDRFDLVAVADVDPDRVRDFASTHGTAARSAGAPDERAFGACGMLTPYAVGDSS